MKGVLTIATVSALLVAPFPAPGQDREEDSGILPVRPQQLWAPMPGQLETWKLLRSTAENRLSGWVESRAVREYEKILEAADGAAPGPGEKPPPPAKTRLVITDTGKHPSAIAHFAEFSLEPDPEEEDVLPKRIASWPAYQINYGEDDLVLEILVADRFLVEIAITHQPEKFLDEWVRRIDLGSLAKVPDTEKVPLPEQLIMMKLDQLKPEKNRAYRLATTSNARQEDELIEDDAWMAEALGVIPEIPDEGDSPHD